MEGCSVDEARRLVMGILLMQKRLLCIGNDRRHKDLMWSLYGAYGPSLVRWRYPIFIDKESVDSVLARPALGMWDSDDFHNPTACHCHEYAVLGSLG